MLIIRVPQKDAGPADPLEHWSGQTELTGELCAWIVEHTVRSKDG